MTVLYRLIVLVMSLLLSIAVTWAGPYDIPSKKAADWLVQQARPVDGSWGTRDDLRFLQTAEAVSALAALNRRVPQYYAGLTWLQNHEPENADYIARRILALQANGIDVTGDLQRLQAVQRVVAPGNGGFGLSQAYQGAALDSALALQAYAQAGISLNAATAVNFLKASQLTGSDAGWALGQESVSDPATTAQAVIALIALRAGDASLAAPIANGLAALNASVNTTSPVIHRALAAIANVRNNAASSQATTLLNSLVVSQAADGSWGGDAYGTALAMRALAAGMASDLAVLATSVTMPDQNLRTAVNLALGRNSLDSITRGDLANLTSLNISNRSVSDLTGLQWAANLTSLIATNNKITSIAPLSGLTKLTQLYLGGNPVGPVAKLSTTGLKFGGQRRTVINTAQNVTLTNTGGALMNISSIAVTGDFSQTSTCGATLAAGASCAIAAKFLPTLVGARNGTLAIVDDATPSPQSVSLQGIGVACARADFNGDCKSDVLWQQPSTALTTIWFMNGTTMASNVGSGSAAADWVVQATGDFDGDGKADILWRQTASGINRIWLMNGSTVVSNVIIGSASTDWVVQAVADFDGDGKADIFWRQTGTGINRIWFMSGNTITANLVVGSASTDWVVQAVGDFDGDGKADVLWRQNGTGITRIWFMNGGTITANLVVGTVGADWTVQAAADFDGDGKADIFWRQNVTGIVSIWLMNGAVPKSAITALSVSPDWVLQGAGDFNGDGRADLLLRQSGTATVAMWLLDGAGHITASATWPVPATWVIQR